MVGIIHKSDLKTFFTFINLLLLFYFGQAQSLIGVNKKALEHVMKAEKYIGLNKLDDALDELNTAKKIDPKFVRIYIESAYIYSRKGQSDKQREEMVQSTIAAPNQYEGYFNLAGFDYAIGHYDDALKSYQSAINQVNIIPEHKLFAENRIKSGKILKEIIQNSGQHKAENIGAGINTAMDEYYPSFTVDNQQLFFTRRLKVKRLDRRSPSMALRDDFNEDIFYSKYDDKAGIWNTAKPLPDNINTNNNEGAVTIAPDGSYMIYTRCPNSVNCDLFISYLKDSVWTDPEELGPPINTRYYETNPCLSSDGNSLYFAASRKGGFGGTDIYVSTRKGDGTWSEPRNLGKNINTDKDEWSPFIHPDNNTLFFASDGHIGFGKRDLFVSHRNITGNWDSALNVGSNINTTKEDLCLMVDRSGKNAYFVSEGIEGGFGGLEIFKIQLPDFAQATPVTYLKGQLFDKESQKAITGTISINDLTIKQNPEKLVNTNSDGTYLVAINNGKEYAINVVKSGYLFYSENFDVKNYSKLEPFIKNIYLQPIKSGAKIVLKNIFFETNSFDLKEQSIPELNKIATLIKENPNIKLEISGHTDNTGTELINKELSNKRAKSVYDFLIKLDKNYSKNLIFKGFGSTKPIATNQTPEGKQENRRTEIMVISTQ